nr:bifunctional UDP-sugar hydrolase/5'-nucleotidase [Priestia taiwanensis]
MNTTVLHIYHTNDIHSHFEQWPKIVRYIEDKKNYHQAKGEEVLLVDIGDHVDRSHLITEGTNGKGNVALLNQANYDYVTIGNNEGITLSKSMLDELYEDANFEVLVANLFEQERLPSWTKPYTIYSLQDDTKIGVIGITVQYPLFYEKLGWEIQDPYVALEKAVEELKGRVNVVILLSHLGKRDDEEIAKRFPVIDVILGAHTHHLFENGKLVGHTLLCCAEKYGHYIGHVTLTIDTITKRLLSKTAVTIPTDSLQEESSEVQETLRALEQQSKQYLHQANLLLKEDLPLEWFNVSPFTSLLAEAIKEWCDADVSMINAGVLLEPLKAGIVTKEDIHRICPHPINPCRLVLLGRTLRTVVERAKEEEMERLEVKGLGFRGKVMGRMVYDGLIVQDDDIYVNGARLQDEEQYTIGTLDMFTFGFLFPELQEALEKEYYMPELLRDVVEWKLKLLNK